MSDRRISSFTITRRDILADLPPLSPEEDRVAAETLRRSMKRLEAEIWADLFPTAPRPTTPHVGGRPSSRCQRCGLVCLCGVT